MTILIESFQNFTQQRSLYFLAKISHFKRNQVLEGLGQPYTPVQLGFDGIDKDRS